MASAIEKELRAGRLARNAGRLTEAERRYAGAAELARSLGSEDHLAHSLRHISDIARERGDPQRALVAAAEAVSTCRAGAGSQLDLANALRVQALALGETGRDEEAVLSWREAREIYDRLDVAGGVEECDSNLGHD